MSNHVRKKHCRLCKSDAVHLVLSLPPTPPANDFVAHENLDDVQQRFPLDVFFCRDCAHVQLLDVVDPKILFRNYVYVSGTSPVFVKHFSDYANTVIDNYNISSDSLVGEIGSNDGTLLKFFQQRGNRVLGIDPAQKIAEKATVEGIETLPEFFTSCLAQQLREKYGAANVIVANNVFAHIDDLEDVVTGVKNWLAPEGIFVFEVSYLKDVYEKTLFDTIYHEHLCYHTVKPLQKFFARQQMEIIDTCSINTHGGSLRVVVQLAEGSREVSSRVKEFIEQEQQLGLDQEQTFLQFSAKIEQIKEQLCAHLQEFKNQGKKIAGFGAPAKATTLMYTFGFGPEYVDFIVDDSPLKQGLYTPGYHIPVLPSAEIYSQKPDYIIVLAWNFAEPIIKNHHKFIEQGGSFIVPLPEVRIFNE